MVVPPIDRAAPVPWYHRPVWVLVLLFAVLGPFGLPYLWKSPRFSQAMKVALTIAVVAYTAFLVRETVEAFRAVERELGGLQELPDL